MLHGAFVGVLAVGFVILELSAPPQSGANIGAGIVGLPLLAFGLPWTLPWVVDPYAFDDMSVLGHDVWLLGAVALNVLLDVAIARYERSVRGRAGERQVGDPGR